MREPEAQTGSDQEGHRDVLLNRTQRERVSSSNPDTGHTLHSEKQPSP